MQANENNGAEDSKTIMKEVSRDLKNTRKSVAELIKYRVALMDGKAKQDEDKIDEYKHKAIDAINHLFDDDIRHDQ